MALTSEKWIELVTAYFQGLLEETGVRASRITVDNAVTGTSTTPAAFDTGISDSVLYDLYISTAPDNIGNVYQCTLGGDEATALWQYKFTIPAGEAGNDGADAHVYFKWAAEEPDDDGDISDTPNAWMGVYSGAALSAPVSYASYTWVNIKGDAGKPFRILGTYADLSALRSSVHNPDVGDMYNVGSSVPYNVYRATGLTNPDDWEDQGPIGGGGLAVSDLLNYVFPVGYIFMSVANTSPASYLGGTWERWGSGRVPVGYDSSNTNFDSVEETGGEMAHALSVAEMPVHSHSVIMNVGGNIEQYGISAGPQYSTTCGELAGYLSNAGGNESHNNLQPYITCYMWKRTA